MPKPVRELKTETVEANYIPVDHPIDLDKTIEEELKRELAMASMITHLWKTKPRIFKMICMHCDTDYLDIYEWARERLRCK